MENSQEIIKEARLIKRKLWHVWKEHGRLTKEKFKNINDKTGQYDVPPELFQNRTHRSGRALIRWKLVKSNNITLGQLKTFYGGVCVELVNEDYFDVKEGKDHLSKYLFEKIGSDEKISAIVSFRNEDGDSGALIARKSYAKFLESVDQKNFSYLKRNKKFTGVVGKGDNSIWSGNLFVSIKGGSQKTFESHSNERVAVFNPAVDYANELVCLDTDLTMSYFAMNCYGVDKTIEGFADIKIQLEEYLRNRIYDDGNLLDYCLNHPSIKIGNGILFDPIQVRRMEIEYFENTDRENRAEVCHNESVHSGLFHFDKKQQFVLSAARPTNLFWSTNLSNMMQQNYSLDDYFEMELQRYKLRKELLNK